MVTLKTKWTSFFKILLDPWTLILFLATIGLMIAFLVQTNRTLVAILTVAATLSSGILGGSLGKRWDEITGESALVARGRAAIRSLKLLFASTVALERRSRLYLARYTKVRKSKAPSDTVSTYLEEVIERCGLIEEETLSSIENWTDIIPEADVKTQIGLITDLKMRVEQSKAELKRATAELGASKGRSEQELDLLRKERADKEAELAHLRQQILEKSTSFGPPLSSGTVTPSVISYIPSPSSVFVSGEYPGLSRGYKVVMQPATGVESVQPSMWTSPERK